MKAGIIGATGYAGVELVRLLSQHPNVTLQAISSTSVEGDKLENIYPSLRNIVDLTLVSSKDVINSCDIIFAAVPHGCSQELASDCMTQGKIFIDLGADFRLHDEDEYYTWYQGKFLDIELHKKSVYAIPELFKNEILQTTLIANPGCYPTTIALGLAPLLTTVGATENSIIIDAKSGVTGAGRQCSQTTHFPECSQAFAPYKIGQHRHTPEIQQTLSIMAKEPTKITFVPHLLPINRGILATIYVTPKEKISLEELYELYKNFYNEKPFVRILPLGEVANINHVTYSNYCDISLHQDPETNRLIIVSTIDNMVKGSAGQAIQNMNLICNFEETAGLLTIPPAF